MFYKTVRFINFASIQQGIFRKKLSHFTGASITENLKFTPPWRILFFGTDQFAVEHLKALYENLSASGDKVVKSLNVVIPDRNEIIQRCAVEEYASRNNLKCFRWPLPKALDEYDVGVVVSFGHLIPKRIIDAFPYGILNVHPSILPRWRGASPIIHTVLNGDQETGISIMEIRPIHFDVGPLLMQSKFPVPDGCTSFQLRDFLAAEGSTMLLHALKHLPRLEKLEYEQTDEGVTYAHKVTSNNARVNWEQQTSLEIDRQYRALSEIFGLRSLWNGHKVRLLEKLSLVEMQDPGIVKELEKLLDGLPPGHVVYLKPPNIICIKCTDGWTGFRKIVVKKPLTAKMFNNGYLSKPMFRSVPFKSQDNELNKFLFKARSLSSSLKTKVINL